MAKKLGFKKNAICSAAALILALVAVFMFFLDFVVVKENLLSTTSAFSGFKVAFGCKEYAEVLGQKILVAEYKAAPLPLIGFILICIAIVAALVTLVPALGKFRKLVALVAALAMVVAAVFMFCTVANWTAVQGFQSSEIISYNLGAGAIVTAILSILGGFAFLGSALLK